MIKPILRNLLATLFALSAAMGASAQAVPQGVATLIVPYPAGSAFDITARRIQTDLEKSLERTVIVENVGGASGSIGAQRMLSADPSKLTMLVGSPNELALPPLALNGVRYKPQDFKMLAHLTSGALALLARPDLPAKSIQELIEQSKNPGAKPLSFGSVGSGSLFHIVGAEFGRRLGIQTTHVPYRGGAPVMQDLMGSQIDITFLPLIPSYIQMAQDRKIKVLAILAPNRNSALPDVPTVDIIPQLKGFHHAMWTGLFVPVTVPKDLAAKVAKSANDVVATKSFREWVAERGNSAGDVMTLDQADAFFARESRRFEQLALEANVSKE